MLSDRHVLLPLLTEQRCALLRLHGLFHADGDGQQLEQAAFGHHQVEQG